MLIIITMVIHNPGLLKSFKLPSEQLIAPAITLINITVLFFLHYILAICSSIGLKSSIILLILVMITGIVFLYLSIFVLVLLYKTCEYIAKNKDYLFIHGCCKPALVLILFILILSSDRNIYVPQSMDWDLISVSNTYNLVLGNITFIILFILICIFSHALFLDFEKKHIDTYILFKHLLTLPILYMKKYGIRKSFKKMKRKVKYFYNQALIWKNTKKSPEDRAKFIKGVMVLIVLLLVFILIRITLRVSIITHLFDHASFISSLLSLLLVIPICAYIFNIGIKYLIGNKKVEKKDYRIFNPSVVHATNLYTIFLSILVLYIVFYGLNFSPLFVLVFQDKFLNYARCNVVDFSNEKQIETRTLGLGQYTTNYLVNGEVNTARPISKEARDILDSKVIVHMQYHIPMSHPHYSTNAIIASTNSKFNSAIVFPKPEYSNISPEVTIKSSNYKYGIVNNNKDWAKCTIDRATSIKIAKDLGIITPYHIGWDNHDLNFIWRMPITNTFGKISSLRCTYNGEVNRYHTANTGFGPWNGEISSIVPNLVPEDPLSYVGSNDRARIIHEQGAMYKSGISKQILAIHRNFIMHLAYMSEANKLVIYLTKASSYDERSFPFFESYVQGAKGIEANLTALKDLGIDLNSLSIIKDLDRIDYFTQGKVNSNAFLEVWRLTGFYTTIESPHIDASLLHPNTEPSRMYFNTDRVIYPTPFVDYVRELQSLIYRYIVGREQGVDPQHMNNIGKKLVKDSFLNLPNYPPEVRDLKLKLILDRDNGSISNNTSMLFHDSNHRSKNVVLYNVDSNIHTLSPQYLQGQTTYVSKSENGRNNMIEWVTNKVWNDPIATNLQKWPINVVVQDKLSLEFFEIRNLAESTKPNINHPALYSLVRINPYLLDPMSHHAHSQYYDESFSLLEHKGMDMTISYFNNKVYKKPVFYLR